MAIPCRRLFAGKPMPDLQIDWTEGSTAIVPPLTLADSPKGQTLTLTVAGKNAKRPAIESIAVYDKH